jgi:alcohol dehydrogenase (cytochrome c)
MGVTNHTCPWLVGSWEAPSYSPDTGLLYQNVVEACNSFDIQRMQPETVPLSGLYYGGSPAAEDPPGAKAYGHLDARDPITGELKWELKFDQPMYSSLLILLCQKNFDVMCPSCCKWRDAARAA